MVGLYGHVAHRICSVRKWYCSALCAFGWMLLVRGSGWGVSRYWSIYSRGREYGRRECSRISGGICKMKKRHESSRIEVIYRKVANNLKQTSYMVP